MLCGIHIIIDACKSQITDPCQKRRNSRSANYSLTQHTYTKGGWVAEVPKGVSQQRSSVSVPQCWPIKPLVQGIVSSLQRLNLFSPTNQWTCQLCLHARKMKLTHAWCFIYTMLLDKAKQRYAWREWALIWSFSLYISLPWAMFDCAELDLVRHSKKS
jgi:hypothetical protein